MERVPAARSRCRDPWLTFLEPVRRQLSVPDRVLDVAMAEIGLQRAGIVAGIGQRKPARMAQHLRMGLEIEAGSSPDTLDHLGKTSSREWRTAIAHKHER
jgi:hypothetical protein